VLECAQPVDVLSCTPNLLDATKNDRSPIDAFGHVMPCLFIDSAGSVTAAEDMQVWMEPDYEQRKRPSPQREGEGQITRLAIRTALPASRLWLGQAMPIVGVSRTAVVIHNQTGCRVTVIAGRNPSRNAADEQLKSKRGRNLQCKR